MKENKNLTPPSYVFSQIRETKVGGERLNS